MKNIELSLWLTPNFLEVTSKIGDNEVKDGKTEETTKQKKKFAYDMSLPLKKYIEALCSGDFPCYFLFGCERLYRNIDNSTVLTTHCDMLLWSLLTWVYPTLCTSAMNMANRHKDPACQEDESFTGISSVPTRP